jgi:ribosomal protein S18 acetylase RimI-like enzyme
MPLTIRDAKKEDMPAVLELIRELAIYEKEPDAVEVTVTELQQHGFGDKPKFYCFVAETDIRVVGMALVYFRYSTWKGPVLHLEDLIITQSHRGKGIGEALYQKVMAYGRRHQVKRVQWEVLGWNEGAIRFYERTGAQVLRDWHVVHMDEGSLHRYIN